MQRHAQFGIYREHKGGPLVVCVCMWGGVPGSSAVKKPPANSGDVRLIPEGEDSPGEGNGNTL